MQLQLQRPYTDLQSFYKFVTKFIRTIIHLSTHHESFRHKTSCFLKTGIYPLSEKCIDDRYCRNEDQHSRNSHQTAKVVQLPVPRWMEARQNHLPHEDRSRVSFYLLQDKEKSQKQNCFYRTYHKDREKMLPNIR